MQRELAEERRGDAQRIDGGADVVVEAGQREFGGGGCAADMVAALVDCDGDTLLRQRDGGGETVGTGADDVGCVQRHEPIVARLGYNRFMAANAVVRSRVSVEVKEEATEVLNNMGLTVSDLMRIVLTRVAKERSLPFDLRPNALTRETLEKSARGEDVHRAEDADDMFEQLGI